MAANIVVYQLVSGQSMGSNFTSPAQQFSEMFVGGVQAVWTGSPVGSIQLLVSNDNITYSVYTTSSQTVSGAGDFYWNLGYVGFPFLKVMYTFISGSGTLNITISAKG